MFYHDEESLHKSMREFLWSIKQNKKFWKNTLLFIDEKMSKKIYKYFDCFKDVFIDYDIPQEVKECPKFRCKGYWAKKAVDLYGNIVFCDFDILVRKMPDTMLTDFLGDEARFMDMPDYIGTDKSLGCGIAQYTKDLDWDKYMHYLFYVHRSEERSWTKVFDYDRDRFLQSGRSMSPYIVDISWLRNNKDERDKVYLLHGISSFDNGIGRLRDIGYSKESLAHFYMSKSEWVNYIIAKAYRGIKRQMSRRA